MRSAPCKMTTALLLCLMLAGRAAADDPPVVFQRQVLTDKYYCDGVAAGDINSDGHVDIVAGPFWYEGPGFRTAHAFYEPVELPPEPSPSNSMFSFVHDFDGDSRPDILVLGRVHKHEAKWYQNPGGADGYWKRHFVFERVRGESPNLIDIDGDAVPELLCHWDGCWGWIHPDAGDPFKPWKFHRIGDDEGWPQFYHGQGIGDVDGDGRLDVIINDGWYQHPATVDAGNSWTFHRHRFSQGRGGAQMFATDVDGDGDNDVISAIDAHGWGLAWYEHRKTDTGIRFREQLIMGDRSREDELGAAFTQPHALDMADIDGDGLPDIVTGKRMWAHGPEGDIEPSAAPVLYWFRLTRGKLGVHYVPYRIDAESGVGVQVLATDVDGDSRVDVVTASKLGTFVFRQVKKN